jgi:hypothetical protein
MAAMLIVAVARGSNCVRVWYAGLACKVTDCGRLSRTALYNGCTVPYVLQH